jgi:hypothetical protein
LGWQDRIRREVRRERETLQKLVLVPYRPFRNLSLGLGGFILIIAAGLLGFYLGNNYGRDSTGASPEEVARLRETVRLYGDQAQRLRDQAAVATHDRDIVLAATEQLRQQNKDLLANISTLEDQVSLYKRLNSPRGASQSLSIDKFELSHSTVRGHVQYRLMLTKVVNNASDTTVSVDVRLSGGGHTVSMPLPASSYTFQYFQNISGDWQLPSGFDPEQVDIVVTPKGGKAARVEKRFKWELKG